MSAFTEDMLKSMAKVEATRAQRLHASIERFTAEEKDELLKEFHPDYSSKGFKVLEVGPNKGQKVPVELAQLLEGKSRLQDVELDLERWTMTLMCWLSAVAVPVLPLRWKRITVVQTSS